LSNNASDPSYCTQGFSYAVFRVIPGFMGYLEGNCAKIVLSAKMEREG